MTDAMGVQMKLIIVQARNAASGNLWISCHFVCTDLTIQGKVKGCIVMSTDVAR